MRNTLLKLYVKSQVLMGTIKEENGQDLVEYAAIIMLVVLGITSGMTTLATGINGVMSSVVSQINVKLGL